MRLCENLYFAMSKTFRIFAVAFAKKDFAGKL